MFGPVGDGSPGTLVRGFLIGCCLGVAFVLGVVGYGVYRFVAAVWGGQ